MNEIGYVFARRCMSGHTIQSNAT